MYMQVSYYALSVDMLQGENECFARRTNINKKNIPALNHPFSLSLLYLGLSRERPAYRDCLLFIPM